jgi:hypothetical protein
MYNSKPISTRTLKDRITKLVEVLEGEKAKKLLKQFGIMDRVNMELTGSQ